LDVSLIYILEEKAGAPTLKIDGENFKYLIKVRRHKVGDILTFRAFETIEIKHSYKIIEIQNRSVVLELVSSHKEEVRSQRTLHIGWCIIDTKSIEKVLPSLCEIGVAKITFIACERSQKNFKLDLKRFERILVSSMQQCGRTSFIEFATSKDLKSFLQDNPEAKVFDFCEQTLENTQEIETVVIGCEGGFSQNEKALVKEQNRFRLDTPMVLRSESAVVAVASKILL
jgi:16S rRNA (uracil1498-N3)-methyltransferase